MTDSITNHLRSCSRCGQATTRALCGTCSEWEAQRELVNAARYSGVQGRRRDDEADRHVPIARIRWLER